MYILNRQCIKVDKPRVAGPKVHPDAGRSLCFSILQRTPISVYPQHSRGSLGLCLCSGLLAIRLVDNLASLRIEKNIRVKPILRARW